MDWVRQHYADQSRVFGRAGVTDRHREIARRLLRHAGALPSPARLLELGAGACGLAGAMAELGHEVLAVEFNPEDIERARGFIQEHEVGGLRLVEADFYRVELEGRFDLVYYWDGFGVGDDADQRRLLDRIGTDWLADAGCALIDVFSPWRWQDRSGEVQPIPGNDGRSWSRKVVFDAVTSRFRDFLRPDGEPGPVYSQTLRLYSLPEFRLLCEGTSVEVAAFYTVDGDEIDTTVEDEAISERLRATTGYLAKLVRRR